MRLLVSLPRDDVQLRLCKTAILAVKGAAFAPAAQPVRSKASFEDFVAALQAGRIVLDVHTNARSDGEISGDVVPA